MTKQQLASAFYRQGVDAMERSDWVRAAELFVRCSRFDPGYEMYRQLAQKCSDKMDSRL